MGTGCTTCNNNKWSETNISDTRIVYSGEAIPSLGICKGDKLNEIEEVILNKILEFMDGEGITLDSLSLTQCDYLKQFIQISNQDKSLEGILSVLLQAVCALNADIETLETTISSTTNFVYDLECLTVSTVSTQTIIQALITELCSYKDAVTDLITLRDSAGSSPTSSKLVNAILDLVGDKILSSIQTCGSSGNALTKTGSGSTAVVTFNAMVPPYSPIPSFAGIENFDSTGKGLADRGFCGWYICNGLNGTPDLRGLSFAGAINVPGATTLRSSVNPNVFLAGASSADILYYTTNMYDVKGGYVYQLSEANLPPHQHTYTVNNHSHTFPFYKFNAQGSSSGYPVMAKTSPGNLPFNGGPDTMTTGVSGNPSTLTGIVGGATKFGVMQPTYFGIWIMRKN